MIAVLATAAHTACGQGGQKPAPAQAAVSVTGRVQVVGATPLEQVVIQPLDSAAAAIETRGAYREELKRLGGATVRAAGSMSSAGQLLVQEYEILEIAGHTPLVGRVEVEGDRVLLQADRGEAVEVRGAPAELLRKPGAKVWVILDSTGAVTGYGIIRE